MDPLCHTLVGGCLAQTGLKRLSGFGTSTLVIAANIPDIDVLAIPFGLNLEVRRGVTHGVLAIVVWPFVLATLVHLYASLRPSSDRAPARFGPLVLIAAIGVLTHPFLDYLNSYGMRWLMPFDGRWYYGDALFIVDPWITAALAVGIWMTRRREHRRVGRAAIPARVAAVGVGLYVLLMIAAIAIGRSVVREAVRPGGSFMVTALPLSPFAKEVLVADSSSYRLGRFRIFGASRLELGDVISRGDEAVARRIIEQSRSGRAFLDWARFPVFSVEIEGDSIRARARDLRYAREDGSSWASFEQWGIATESR